MTKLKILLITARSDHGGGPKHVAEIIEFLGNDFELYVAAPNEGHYASYFQKHAEGFFPLPHKSFNVIALFRLLSFAKKNEIKIVHSHGFGAGLYSRLLGLFNFKVLHTFHGLHLKSDLKSKIKSYAERFLGQVTDGTICVSLSEQRKAKQLGLRALIISNGLAPQILPRKKDGFNWPPRKIGVLSRLDPHKNVGWIIDHFKDLANENPEVELLIAGDGEEKDLLTNKAKGQNIKFLGFQETYAFFDQIDLLLSASLGEGLPYTILEAMGYEIPVMASDVDGHSDLLPKSCLFSLDEKLALPTERILLSTEGYHLDKNMQKLADLYLSYQK